MKQSLLLLVFLLMFLGCEFPLDDENNVEISDTPKNNIEIALENLPDTVAIINSLGVSYSLDVEGFPAIAIFSVIGNEAEYIGYDYSGSFTISNLNSQITTKGYLPFEFVVLTTSRTGSLADRSQRELILFSVKRVFYFDYSPVTSVNFTKAEDKDGSIYLSWDKYPHRNLSRLLIEKTLNNTGNTTIEYIDLNTTETSFRDNSFLGTEVEYRLITENNLLQRGNSEKVKFTTTPSKITTFNATGSNQLQLKWNKNHFYNNSVGYQLHRWSLNGSPIYSTPNSSDTICTLNNVPFGEDMDLFLITNSNKVSNNTTTKSAVWLGKKKPAFKAVAYDKTNGAFFYLNSSYLIKEKNGARDSASIDFEDTRPSFISANGESVFVSSNSVITEVSTSTLAPQHYYPISDNFTSFIPYGDKVITASRLQSGYPALKVYDKTSGGLIQTFPLTDIPAGGSNKVITKISNTPRTDYILGDGGDVGIFKVAKDGTIESAKFAQGTSAVISSDGNYVYVFYDYYRYKYTFPELERVDGAEVYLPIHSYSYIFDKDNGLIAMSGYYEVTIADMETLTTLKKIKLTLRPGSFALSNGTLFVNVTEGGAYAYDLGL